MAKLNIMSAFSVIILYLQLSQSFDDRIEVSFHHVVFCDIIVCVWLFHTLRKYVIKERFLGNAYFTGNMSEFSPQILSEIFLVPRKNLRDIVINLLTFSLNTFAAIVDRSRFNNSCLRLLKISDDNNE
jgi:hypothetical protein